MRDAGSKKLQQAIIEVVNNQLRKNDPPETRQTFNRLVTEGFSEQEAVKLIGYVVATEVFAVIKDDRRYDETAYVAALRNLPRLPWDKEDAAE
jgi:hypothetical protein